MSECPYCLRIRTDDGILERGPLAVALVDQFPVSPGHTLIVPMRHEPDYFSLTAEEQAEMLRLLRSQQARLQRELSPDAFNLGVNTGPAAGQTIPHTHVHLIPRFKGDVPDPRGGVRWVIPAKANYWDAIDRDSR